MGSWFEYPVTRPFDLPCFTPFILVLGLFWISITTIISIVTVGYESLTIYSDQFNVSNQLWYEKVFPQWQWIPKSSVCDGSSIKIKECTAFLLH